MLQQRCRIVTLHANRIQPGHISRRFVDHCLGFYTQESTGGRVCEDTPQLTVIVSAIGGDPAQPDDTIYGMIDQRTQKSLVILYFPLGLLDVADIAKHQDPALFRGHRAGRNRRHLQVQETPGVGHHSLRFTGAQCSMHLGYIVTENLVYGFPHCLLLGNVQQGLGTAV